MPNYLQTASLFVHGETHNQKELFIFGSCQQCQVVCELDAFRLTIFIPQTNCPYVRDLKETDAAAKGGGQQANLYSIKSD